MKIEAFRGWTAFAKRLLPIVMLGILCGYLSACNFSIGGDPTYPEDRDRSERGAGSDSTIFGEGGLFGDSKARGPDNGATGVGVNSLLWRASLDTISFMPLVSADPFGGVIITDWYTPPQTPDERFKVNIYILGRALRADGVRASVGEAMRSLRADLAASAQAPRGQTADEPVDVPTAGASALREVEMVLSSFRQQVRADLRRQATRGTLTADTVTRLRDGLEALRRSL